MSIYARTEEGQWAAYSPESALPRKLKSLLKVIDGKTSMGVYVQTLSAFGDVKSVFASLLAARLIEPVQEGSVRVNPIANLGVREILQKPIAGNEWNDTLPPEPSKAQTQLARAQLGMQTGAWSTDAPSTVMLQRSVQKGSADEQDTQRGLKHAVGLMSDFVIQYLPSDAFAVLKELEELQTIEQLAATFGGYEQIAKQAGEPSAAHLQQLRRLVAEHI